MARFKPLSVKSLPRVMVAILAMETDDRVHISRAIRERNDVPALLRDIYFEMMAEHFHAILQLPKDQQGVYVDALNSALDDLRRQDAFGTEGQLDPRGDDR